MVRSGISQGTWTPTCGECGSNPATYLGTCHACTRDYLVLAVIRGDLPGWNADNECVLCGEHMADPHDPSCEMLNREDGS